MISDVLVEILGENKLKTSILGDFPEESQFHFYLIRGSKVISKDGWFSSSDYLWEDLEPGIYSVRGFVRFRDKKIDAFSRSVRVSSVDFHKSIEPYLGNKNPLEPVPFFDFEYPHTDFAYCITSGALPELKRFNCTKVNSGDKEFGLYLNKENGYRSVAFSGSAFFNNDLIFGSEDFFDLDSKDYSKFDTLVGDYAMAYFSENRFKLSTDFFGNHRVFYFHKGDFFLASNRLQLLLILLAKLRIDVEVDKPMLSALLAGGSIQPFQQLYSHCLPLKGIKLLPINKRLEADLQSGDVSFLDKEISDFLSGNHSGAFSEDVFKAVVDQGLCQVKRQTRAVLNHKKFKHVLVDSTGGMDTRVILSAVSNFASKKDKIRINACDTKTIPDDIKIGCALASLCGYEHDDLPETHLRVGLKKRKMELISKSLGSYFATDFSNVPASRIVRDDTININGFYGEICLRPYYTRNYLNQEGFREVEDRKDLYKYLVNLTKLGDDNAASLHDELFFNSVNSMPGRSLAEKYDLFYLFFRNGFHCSDTLRPNNSTPRVGVIQSPFLFEAKRMLFEGTKSSTFLQNYFISLLNPTLLKIPYASKADNYDYLSCKADLTSIPNSFGDIDVSIVCDGSSAVNAREKKKITVKESDHQTNDDINIINFAVESAVYLYKNDLITECLFLELCNHFNFDGNTHVAANKVISYAQCHYILNCSELDLEAVL